MAQRKLYEARIDVPVTKRVREELEALAAREEVSPTALARRILTDYLREHALTEETQRRLLEEQ